MVIKSKPIKIVNSLSFIISISAIPNMVPPIKIINGLIGSIHIIKITNNIKSNTLILLKVKPLSANSNKSSLAKKRTNC